MLELPQDAGTFLTVSTDAMSDISRGFTLLEALVAIALLAILSSVAAPGMAQMLKAQQLRHAGVDLGLALRQARHEAIARQRPVIVTNLDGNWANGWKVFVDLDGDGAPASGEPELRSNDGIASGLRISGNTPISRYVRYTPTGEAKMQSGAFQTGTITLCHEDGSQTVRRLVLSATGRLRSTTEAAGNC